MSAALHERTGFEIGGCDEPCAMCIPEELNWRDGLSEEEAVELALLNNASFRELAADLGLTCADVIQSRQLTNPDFACLFPTGAKQLEFTLSVPLEALWLRPRRTKIAATESQRVANRLVQDGLNLIRDVRFAYSDAILARQRAQLAEESARLRGRLADLAAARLRAGTATELDLKTARIDELMEREQAARLRRDAELAAERLRHVMGLSLSDLAIETVDPRPSGELDRDAESLVEQALAVRPDLWAAGWAVAAAADKARLARHDYFQVSAMLPNLKHPGRDGTDIGPGVKFTVPIFHQNQGAIARAEAELAKAERHCELVRQTVALEVRQAHTRYLQAQEDLRKWSRDIVPELERAVQMSEKAYENQSTSLLLMLDNSRRLLTAQVRQAEAAADLRRAAAELERSVGWGLWEDADETAAPSQVADEEPAKEGNLLEEAPLAEPKTR